MQEMILHFNRNIARPLIPWEVIRWERWQRPVNGILPVYECILSN